ncbi:RNA-directed DNA polymerase, eukaryota [Tanacetum coccineum]|uniref:RNA-directed DNA polymerase, eukaryota n=1 Tax=Tanacetum coccineum TaxID=301880 RepID=A0ABQ4Y4E5_9ASTR
MEVLNSLQDLDKLDVMELAQKAKIKWAIEGDENSKWIESPILVKSEFLSYFASRFDKPPEYRLHIDMDFPNKLSLDQQADLENNITREEIKKAVWDCGVDKSPGPDGFTFDFYRRYWTFLENDVVEVVLYFFNYGQFPKGSNSSFITLIPKTQEAKMMKDFRPITLIGSLYKIIAKILAIRMGAVLEDLVNDVQSAFVAKRQILGGPFILNELFQWYKMKKKHSMIFKVDFEKAYDLVRWDYLDDILKKFGFGEKWCGWIRNCLLSSKGSVIVNGSPTKEFQFHRGLKHGYPLSPFLVILIMECLHISMQRVVDAGLFRGSSENGIHTMSFCNGIEHNGKKQIWVKWNKVLASKEKGGLGVSSFYALNRALLFKWVWRFRTQQLALWTKVIKWIHGEDGKLGNGEDTRFWEDKWRGDNTFKSDYPRMYALETQKNVLVASKISHADILCSFRRAPRGGVKESQFFHLVKNVEGVTFVDMKDRWRWSLEGCGDFSVASVRKVLDDSLLPIISSKTRWIKAVPIKTYFSLGKLGFDSYLLD